MGVTLKIGFNGRKKDLRPFWVPLVFKLKPAGSQPDLDRWRMKGDRYRDTGFKNPSCPLNGYLLLAFSSRNLWRSHREERS